MSSETAHSRTGNGPGILALAGIAAPIIFVGSAIGQALARPGYSAVTQMVSELAAYPGGWIQNLSFVVTGALMAAFGYGLHRGVKPGPGGVIGPALIVLSGLGLIVAGAFPVRFEAGTLIEPAGHIIGSLIAFWGAAIGYIVLSRRMAADPEWKGRSAVALGTGIGIVVLFFVFVGLGMPPEAPLHPWLGIAQRAMIAAWFIGVLILAFRLRTVARGAP